MMTGEERWAAVVTASRARGVDPVLLERQVLLPGPRGVLGWRWWAPAQTSEELYGWLMRRLDELAPPRTLFDAPAPAGAPDPSPGAGWVAPAAAGPGLSHEAHMAPDEEAERGDDMTLQERLAEPFALGDIEFRAGATSGNRALALGYIDARVVMDRLDAVVGMDNWKDQYVPLANGCVECTLSLRLGGEWVSKTDVGGPSDQKDVGDHTKAAYSDALKRAAVKWGVGRYLYSLPPVWVDYDPVKKQLLKTPPLAPEFLPRRKAPAPPKPAPAANGQPRPPATPEQVYQRLKAKDAQLDGEGLLTQANELVDHVRALAAGWGERVESIDPRCHPEVFAAVKEFEARARARKAAQPAGGAA